MNKNRTVASHLVIIAAAGALTLAGCTGASNTGGTEGAGAASSSAPPAQEQGASASSGNLKISGAWVKATRGGMTAVFGTLTNTGDKPIKITGASASATDTVQLHTTVKDSDGSTKMQQVQEFTVEPGATFEMKPGGDHIMLMDMNCVLSSGGTTTVTISADDGTTLEFKPLVRDYTGAKEEYQGDAHSTGSASASHDGHHHEEHSHGASSGSATGKDAHHDGEHGHSSASATDMPQCH